MKRKRVCSTAGNAKAAEHLISMFLADIFSYQRLFNVPPSIEQEVSTHLESEDYRLWLTSKITSIRQGFSNMEKEQQRHIDILVDFEKKKNLWLLWKHRSVFLKNLVAGNIKWTLYSRGNLLKNFTQSIPLGEEFILINYNQHIMEGGPLLSSRKMLSIWTTGSDDLLLRYGLRFHKEVYERICCYWRVEELHTKCLMIRKRTAEVSFVLSDILPRHIVRIVKYYYVKWPKTKVIECQM